MAGQPSLRAQHSTPPGNWDRYKWRFKAPIHGQNICSRVYFTPISGVTWTPDLITGFWAHLVCGGWVFCICKRTSTLFMADYKLVPMKSIQVQLTKVQISCGSKKTKPLPIGSLYGIIFIFTYMNGCFFKAN